MQFNIKESYPHLVALVIFILTSVVYFSPQFQGKVIRQTDIISHKGMIQESIEYEKETGETALWTNSMFGGMPTYQIRAAQKNNLIKYVYHVLRLGFDSPAGLFIIGMLGFYVLMLYLGVGPWLSAIASLFFAFSSNNVILLEAGHTSKLQVIMVSAPVIAGVLGLLQKKYLSGGALFMLGMALNLRANHPQMTYYLAMIIAPLVLIYLIKAIKNKEIASFSKASGIMVLGVILALGSTASKLWPTYEYSKDTMRGSPILKLESQEAQSSSETKGLEWNYAMTWSNGALDVMTVFIPGIVGGGSGEWVGKESAFAKAVGSNRDTQAPLYWGSLPFTSGPAYFGAVAIFLFILSLFLVKGEMRIWIVIGVLLTLLISMGKNMAFFNKLLFDYLPLYNKFRSPSSVSSVTAILIPMLGLLGLAKLIKNEDKSQYIKPLYITTGILGGLSLVLALIGPSLFNMSAPGDAQYAQYPNLVDAILDDRASLLRSSSFRSFLFVMITAGAIWLYLKSRIGHLALVAIVGLAGFTDLIQIDRKYLSERNFVSQRQYKQIFQPRPVDTQILQDTDPHYRVFDATINTFRSSTSSYFHKTIGGYHAAKLQRIQDLIDRHIANNNMSALNMLNTKYFILPGQDGNPIAQRNTASLGNAWFVDDIRMVEDANAEIDALSNFDDANEAIVHSEFESYLSGLDPQKNGSIRLTKYTPNAIDYESSSTSEQLAVFSEIWYGPDKGWKAYIDGKPVPHIRANYALRALKIPAGQHQIRFEFKPRSFYLGETISLISSSLILLFCGFVIYQEVKRRKV